MYIVAALEELGMVEIDDFTDQVLTFILKEETQGSSVCDPKKFLRSRMKALKKAISRVDREKIDREWRERIEVAFA